MNGTTKLMIQLYKLDTLGYDFMGYEMSGNGMYTYHHFIIPKRNGGSYSVKNGAIIRGSPHDYLHIIEKYDLEIFNLITSEMIDMNLKGYLDYNNIVHIDELLSIFERDYASVHNKKGSGIVKEEYTRRLVRRKY